MQVLANSLQMTGGNRQGGRGLVYISVQWSITTTSISINNPNQRSDRLFTSHDCFGKIKGDCKQNSGSIPWVNLKWYDKQYGTHKSFLTGYCYEFLSDIRVRVHHVMPAGNRLCPME